VEWGSSFSMPTIRGVHIRYNVVTLTTMLDSDAQHMCTLCIVRVMKNNFCTWLESHVHCVQTCVHVLHSNTSYVHMSAVGVHMSAVGVHMSAVGVHITAVHVHITAIHVNAVHLTCTLCTTFHLRCTPAHPTDIVYIIPTEVACLHVLQTLCTIYLRNLH
jgi:hypothetical protein